MNKYLYKIKDLEIPLWIKYWLLKRNKLPKEYEELEYIESTGTQYIDTGFKANKTIEFEGKYKLKSVNDFLSLFGGRISLNNQDFQMYIDTSTIGELRVGQYPGVKIRIPLNIETDIKYRNKTLSINDTTYSVNPLSTWNTSQYNTFLFATNTAGQVDFRGTEQLYYMKFYLGGNLIRHFIPCKRNSDNEIGLYDLVNNVFYENSGLGIFNYKEKGE